MGTCMLAMIRPARIVQQWRTDHGVHRWRVEQIDSVCVCGGGGAREDMVASQPQPAAF
jgi:hypothetical protein